MAYTEWNRSVSTSIIEVDPHNVYVYSQSKSPTPSPKAKFTNRPFALLIAILQQLGVNVTILSPVYSGTLSANEDTPVCAGPGRIRLVAIGAPTVIFAFKKTRELASRRVWSAVIVHIRFYSGKKECYTHERRSPPINTKLTRCLSRKLESDLRYCCTSHIPLCARAL